MGKTINQFQNAKISRERISMCTAYDYTTAKIAEDAGIDVILVGDSLGMTMLGYDTTLQVTMEDMIHHTKAVKRGAQNTFVICDMPFMSYQTNVYDAVKNAGRLIKEGMADAVKLEGGMNVKEQIRAIVNASIPVMAHIGMTPQSVSQFGGFKVQGKNYDSARQIIEDAKAVEEAGAFAVTLECVPNDLAALITKVLDIPTIGIGAGAKCNGQVLVYQDMLGMTSDIHPKFVKQFAHVGDAMKEGFSRYIKEVKSGSFPSKDNTYSIEEEVMERLVDIKKEAEKKAMKRHIIKPNKDKQDNTQGQGDKE